MDNIAKGGTVVTEEMLDRWTEEAERGEYGFGGEGVVYTGGIPVDEDVKPIRPDVLINPTLWDLIQYKADRLGVSVNEVVTQALTRELTVL